MNNIVFADSNYFGFENNNNNFLFYYFMCWKRTKIFMSNFLHAPNYKIKYVLTQIDKIHSTITGLRKYYLKEHPIEWLNAVEKKYHYDKAVT